MSLGHRRRYARRDPDDSLAGSHRAPGIVAAIVWSPRQSRRAKRPKATVRTPAAKGRARLSTVLRIGTRVPSAMGRRQFPSRRAQLPLFAGVLERRGVSRSCDFDVVELNLARDRSGTKRRAATWIGTAQMLRLCPGDDRASPRAVASAAQETVRISAPSPQLSARPTAVGSCRRPGLAAWAILAAMGITCVCRTDSPLTKCETLE